MSQVKNAIVTGSNRGIGYAILEKFAANGYNIWACARKYNEDFEQNLALLAKKNNVWIKPIYFDLNSDEAIKTGFKEIFLEKKNIDVLINNAGIAHTDIFQMTSMNKVREIYNINVFSTMLLTQLVLKCMLKQKEGNIINLASIAGYDTYSTNCIYGSSKAAIISFTKSLAAEMSKHGIRVNAIAPGSTETDMISQFAEKFDGDLASKAALGRFAKPQEIANVAWFLACDESSYINGSIIRVDGGQC